MKIGEKIKQEIIGLGLEVYGDEKFRTVKIYDEVYPNYYISNYGRVWSCNVNRFMSYKIDSYGYVRYRLHTNGKEKYISGQRLVAFRFVRNPKPDEYNVVHHKDENPLNNYYKNLMWTDDKCNLNWKDTQKRRAAKRMKKVAQFDLAGNLLMTFMGLPEIKDKLGYNGSVICNHIKNGIEYDGYYWRHVS